MNCPLCGRGELRCRKVVVEAKRIIRWRYCTKCRTGFRTTQRRTKETIALVDVAKAARRALKEKRHGTK